MFCKSAEDAEEAGEEYYNRVGCGYDCKPEFSASIVLNSKYIDRDWLDSEPINADDIIPDEIDNVTIKELWKLIEERAEKREALECADRQQTKFDFEGNS